jgi:dolichol kinase
MLALIFALLYFLGGWLPAATLSISTLVLFSIIEIWRLRDPDFPLKIVVTKIIKPDEKNRVAAYFYFVLAATILIFIFPAYIMIISLLVAAVADAAAAIVGYEYGKHHFEVRGNVKSFEGLIAGGLAAFFITWGSLFYFKGFYPLTSLIVALVFIALDYFTPPINDNLLNPISAAVTLTLCSFILTI